MTSKKARGHYGNCGMALAPHAAEQCLLSDQEAERYGRFRFAADRDGYLAKRLLVRGVLSRYVGVEPAVLRFTANEFGRPVLVGDGAGWRFSLARSGDLAVCAVTAGARVGVDVEDVLEPACEEVPDGVLAASEREAMAGLPEGERWTAFLRCWTLKEAYLKACGVGLTVPPEAVAFFWDRAGAIGCDVEGTLLANAPQCRLAQVSVGGRYVVALAVSEDEEVRP